MKEVRTGWRWKSIYFIDMSGARCSTSGGGKTIGWLCRILCGTYLSGLGGQHLGG